MRRDTPEDLDVDVRFLLANERTLLSWVRTSLATMAGGLAFSQFGLHSQLKNLTGIAFILFGGLMSIIGYVRFKEADRAIRQGRLPKTGNNTVVQVAAVALFAVLIVAIKLAVT